MSNTTIEKQEKIRYLMQNAISATLCNDPVTQYDRVETGFIYVTTLGHHRSRGQNLIRPCGCVRHPARVP